MIDVTTVLVGIVGALGGLFAGYWVMPTNAHLREQNKMLKGKIASLSAEAAQYNEGVPVKASPEQIQAALASGDLSGILDSLDLPIGIKPIAKIALEYAQKNPEIVKKLLDSFVPARATSKAGPPEERPRF